MPIRDHNPSHKLPLITVSLILINIYVFFLEFTNPDPEGFIYTYGLVKNNLNFNELSALTPLISAMFLHGGLLHIGSNMLFLWVFGDNVEAALGKVKFLLFYLIGGVFASLVQLPLTSPNIPIIGASGAIAAVLGGYLILYPKAKIDMIIPVFFFPAVITVPASIMLIYWFITQVFVGVTSLGVQSTSSGGIAFFAHIGGFIAGFLLVRLLKSKTTLS